MMSYKDYLGEAFYDSDMKMFSGRVANAKAAGTFYGTTVDELENAFHEPVDYYLDLCKRKGVEAEKPFSGKMSLRIPLQLHQKLYQSAREEGKSVNRWVVERLEHLFH
ncbi:MAG: type II toxin-antitoxin system HicB family antitoxin [Desulfobacterales bacterium]